MPHNNIDFILFPIMHFSHNMFRTPTVATLYTQGLNNQLIHQCFDHRSMRHILKMKKGKMMYRLPMNITKFHDEHKCPICLLSKSTKMKQNKKFQPGYHIQKENFNVWITPSGLRYKDSHLFSLCYVPRHDSHLLS